MAIYIDVHSKNIDKIEETITGLTLFSGVCIFIDITNSTDIKYKKGLNDWIFLNFKGIPSLTKFRRLN